MRKKRRRHPLPQFEDMLFSTDVVAACARAVRAATALAIDDRLIATNSRIMSVGDLLQDMLFNQIPQER